MAKFTVKKASKGLIKMVAHKYCAERYATFETVGGDFGLTARVASDLLYRGIAEDILSDEISDKIYNKVVNCKEKGRRLRELRWDKAFDERTERRSTAKREKRERDTRIAELEHKLSVYDEYFNPEDEGAPAKEDLLAELAVLKSLS